MENSWKTVENVQKMLIVIDETSNILIYKLCRALHLSSSESTEHQLKSSLTNKSIILFKLLALARVNPRRRTELCYGIFIQGTIRPHKGILHLQLLHI